jgi:hypothetical protein
MSAKRVTNVTPNGPAPQSQIPEAIQASPQRDANATYVADHEDLKSSARERLCAFDSTDSI